MKKLKSVLKQNPQDVEIAHTKSEAAPAKLATSFARHLSGRQFIGDLMHRLQNMVKMQRFTTGSLEFQSRDFGALKLAAEVRGGHLKVNLGALSGQVSSELTALKGDLEENLKLLGFEEVDLSFGSQSQGKQQWQQKKEEEIVSDVKLTGDQEADLELLNDWLRRQEIDEAAV